VCVHAGNLCKGKESDLGLAHIIRHKTEGLYYEFMGLIYYKKEKFSCTVARERTITIEQYTAVRTCGG
jgi:hypothetical protein